MRILMTLLIALVAHSAQANDIYVRQVGSNNLTDVSQSGGNNVLSQEQAGDDNTATAVQQGSNNNKDLPNVSGVPVVDGIEALQHQTQIGNSNNIALEQIGTNNSIVQYQLGDHNTANLRQNGNNNTSIQVQEGDWNFSDVKQDGNSNLSSTVQTGDNDSVTVFRQVMA